MPKDAEAWWRGLLDGSSRLVTHWDEADERRLLLRRVDPTAPPLTKRECAVVLGATRGRGVTLIALELGIAPATASEHLASAMQKLCVRTRAQLVMLFASGSQTLLPPAGLRAARAAPDEMVLRFPLRTEALTLTRTEQLICRHILAGLGNLEIARRRGRSQRTIANQIASIYAKLDVGSRGELTSLLANHSLSRQPAGGSSTLTHSPPSADRSKITAPP